MIDDKALNEPGEATTQDTTPVVEEKAPEEVAAPEAGEIPAEAAETEPGESKKGYSQRVRELVKERNEEREKRMSLQQKMEELNQRAQPNDIQIPPLPSEPLVQPGEEIDAAELNRRIAERDQKTFRTVDAIAQLRIKQSAAANRVEREAAEALRMYPQLDPDSDEFNSELSEAITESTEAYVLRNPYTASVKAHVGKLMKPYLGAVTKEVGKATETVAKQVSETALRPTSVRKTEKEASEMTLEELETKLGIVHA